MEGRTRQYVIREKKSVLFGLGIVLGEPLHKASWSKLVFIEFYKVRVHLAEKEGKNNSDKTAV